MIEKTIAWSVMTPTNKLRWFLRAAYAPPVLQQWWENEPTTYEDIGVTGEWRDVPTEVQTVPVEEQA